MERNTVYIIVLAIIGSYGIYALACWLKDKVSRYKAIKTAESLVDFNRFYDDLRDYDFFTLEEGRKLYDVWKRHAFIEATPIGE